MPLAGRLRADIDIDIPIRRKTDFRAFGLGAAGRLQVIGEADAAPLARRDRLRSPGRKPFPVGGFECGVEHAW